MKREVKRLSFYSLAATAAVLLAIGGQAGAAGDNSGQIAVGATVNKACVVTNSPSIAFGSFNPVDNANVNQTGTISLSCTKGAAAIVALDAGGNPGKAASGTRAMKDGASPPDYLGYEIYQDSGYATVWGGGAGETGASAETEAAAANMTAVNYTAYGQIPTASNNQGVPAGSYTDTVNISISF